jgi:hypothetical protein
LIPIQSPRLLDDAEFRKKSFVRAMQWSWALTGILSVQIFRNWWEFRMCFIFGCGFTYELSRLTAAVTGLLSKFPRAMPGVALSWERNFDLATRLDFC